MQPPRSTLLRKCVAAEKALPFGSAARIRRAGREKEGKRSSAHRGPDVPRKRTPVEPEDAGD
eukprot:scaffold3864_cov59-Phaeocystis_antarctica.AAC.5